jgi:hypothetical protein
MKIACPEGLSRFPYGASRPAKSFFNLGGQASGIISAEIDYLRIPHQVMEADFDAEEGIR